jgi:hypothetical protein
MKRMRVVRGCLALLFEYANPGSKLIVGFGFRCVDLMLEPLSVMDYRLSLGEQLHRVLDVGHLGERSVDHVSHLGHDLVSRLARQLLDEDAQVPHGIAELFVMMLCGTSDGLPRIVLDVLCKRVELCMVATAVDVVKDRVVGRRLGR